MFNLCMHLICVRLTKDILFNIRNFLEKIDSYLEKYKFARLLKSLDSSKFLEILNSNKTPNEFSTTKLKGTFLVDRLLSPDIVQFRSACLRTAIFLRELTLSSTLSIRRVPSP